MRKRNGNKKLKALLDRYDLLDIPVTVKSGKKVNGLIVWLKRGKKSSGPSGLQALWAPKP